MKAVTYQGTKEVQVKEVEVPKITHPQDMIIKATSTAICGSDLHLYQGNMPLRPGYIIGHEPMGNVEETGPEVTKVKKGTGLSSRSMYHAANASFVRIIWKANVITQIITKIPAVCLVIQNNTETIRADRRSY